MQDAYRLSATTCINQRDKGLLIDYLISGGHAVFEIDGRGVTDKMSFIARAIECLPHGMAVNKNWDALFDSLWVGLSKVEDNRVAILWSCVEEMLDHGLPDLLVALSGLQELAHSIADTKTGFPHSIQMIVVLLGSGTNFPPLSNYKEDRD
jgi:hypothetical protein